MSETTISTTISIRPEITTALREEGIVTPTLIQEKAIPLIRSGGDVIGMSETGSGKTAAFAVPVLERLVPGSGLQVLIVCPIRELAVQIAGELRKFGKYMSFSIATVYGGVSYQTQLRELPRADIVVGTPGRLCDHLQNGTLDLRGIRCVVLDEADKMAEMGFIEDIRYLLDATPRERQTLLFGATISDKVGQLEREYMNKPSVAKGGEQVREEFLEQYYIEVEQHEKFSLLVHLLRTEQTGRVIVFCSTKSMVDILARNLRSQRFDAEMIHGNLVQSRRLRALEEFNRKKNGVLVASPVAARGLDIKGVTHIFNYDLSKDAEEYVHRVGRTARAGESGIAVTLLSQRDYEVFSDIMNRYQLDVKEEPCPDFPRLHFDARRERRGGDRGGYGSRDGGRGDSRGGRGSGYRGGGRSTPRSGGRSFRR